MKRILQITAGLIFFLLFLASCSGDVTRPADLSTTAADGSDPSAIADPSRVDIGSIGSISPGTGMSRWIRGDVGGAVTSGRFTVWFKAGSLPTNTFVTVRTLKMSGSMVCEILPLNLTLRSPATLIVDLRGVRTAAPYPDTVLWYDSQLQIWTDIGSTFLSRGAFIETEISRLGRYMAGWSGK